MTNPNKTSNIEYRFLSEEDFSALYQTSLEAFADYFIKMQMTEDQFENRLVQTSVDLKLSVGAFSENYLIGYTLNGFGDWNGKPTAYDSGTGVVPEFRSRGIGKSMFDFMTPRLKKMGIKQILLEVIMENKKAIGLYKKLGFEETRKLIFFEQMKKIKAENKNKIEIKQINEPDWNHLKTFWDSQPSWQFSALAVEKSLAFKLILGAYLDNNLVGYSVLFPKSGTVAQIGVNKNYRGKGVGLKLLTEMQDKTEDDKKLVFGNVDNNLDSLNNFLNTLDFKQTTSQYEMIKPL